MAKIKNKKKTARNLSAVSKNGESPYRVPALIGAVIVVGCVLLVGAAMGVYSLWRGVTQMDEFRVHPDEVSFNSDWVKPDALKAELKRRDASGLLSRPCSIFTKDLALRVARAYARSPWIREVKSVSKVFPNRLDVHLEVREPFAVVKIPGGPNAGYFCVDEEGVVLSPAVYDLSSQRLATLAPLVVAHDTRGKPQGGRLWGELTVLEGVKMLRLCRLQFADSVTVKEIEVQKVRLGNGLEFANAWLNLDGGTRIEWGRTPSAIGSHTEPSTPRKTAMLQALLSREGAHLTRWARVDIRHEPPKCDPRPQP